MILAQAAIYSCHFGVGSFADLSIPLPPIFTSFPTGRAPSTAVTVYAESAAERSPVAAKLDLDSETQYLGRTAAASATATVGMLTSQFSTPSGGHITKATKAADEMDAQIEAVRRMRIAREVIEEVQHAWIEVTGTATEGEAVPGLLDGITPSASDFVDAHEPPPLTERHAAVGWFAKSLDLLTRHYRPGFEVVMNGPWI